VLPPRVRGEGGHHLSHSIITRFFVRDAKTKRWHEVSRSGAADVTAFCGRLYRQGTYDKRTSWPAHGVLRCQPCVKKALSSRT
jgi:hypothetical protein